MASLELDKRLYPEEREEYFRKCMERLNGIDGNIPFPDYAKAHRSHYTAINYDHIWSGAKENERYYLSENPYCLTEPVTDKYKILLPTGIKFTSLTTHEVICCDILEFLRVLKGVDGKRHFTNGEVNIHLRNCLKDAIPYLTLREAINVVITYVRGSHVYFTKEYVPCLASTDYDRERTYCCNFFLYHCHIAYNVNNQQR